MHSGWFFKGKQFYLLLSFVAVVACTAKPTDSFTTGLLEQVSKNIDGHYSRIIASQSPVSCRLSSSESQEFWSKTEVDLRVLKARVLFWPINETLIDDVEALEEALTAAKDKEVIAQEEPTRLSGGGLWPCLDADEAGRTWSLLSRSVTDLTAASKIATF